MAEKILIEKYITKEVEAYLEEIQEEIEKELSETANKIVDYIKNNAPRSSNSSNHLADSFTVKKEGSAKFVKYIIHSKTKGRMAHLVEFGFEHRNGKFISGRPFLRPAFDLYSPKMVINIIKIIRSKQ